MNNNSLINDAYKIIVELGLPKAQHNERSALVLLALLNLTPNKSWADSEAPLMGITPIMNWISMNYSKKYAPNTRETLRRKTIHQYCDAGIVIYNPDNSNRAVNSPNYVYQIEEKVLGLLRTYGMPQWDCNLNSYLAERETLVSRYAKMREQNRIKVRIINDEVITLSPGVHSELIRDIIENFAPRFAPGSDLIYVGDTGNKAIFVNNQLLDSLGIAVNLHGKMPDVVLYYREKHWLLLIECVTSHGPVDGKRQSELAKIFAQSSAGLVYVTAFPNKSIMGRYLGEIAWETEVWVSDTPSHLIHFNGVRFLGPYDAK
jgi:hypothetical protein